jgi:AraC family transcriptional regulator of adaptative response / DNA-3-methyladenine glycosylase II
MVLVQTTITPRTDVLDVDACYRAVSSRDRRFDGVFYTAVHTTGIYCRPSCPARTPAARNVTFHRTAASAQAAGFRACKRCLPDATPGSPRWDVAADVAGRAMRLIADGVVEREGVEGLAARLGYSARHLTRLLAAELGAGPLALARAQRAQNARVLIETSGWRLGDVAFAAGFSSVRQFNDTIREVYSATPSELRRLHLRRTTGTAEPSGSGRVDVRLAVRAPFDAHALEVFLARHLVPGVEAAGPGWFARSLRLPHGPATLRLDLAGPHVRAAAPAVHCRLHLSDLRDLAPAVERCRRLLDADCDPVAVDAALATDDLLAPLVAQRPGLRVPGHVDGDELAVRTVLGQQVSLAAANRLCGVVAALAGEALPDELATDGVERLFPSSAQVAALDDAALPVPRARAKALSGLASALAAGEVSLDRSADRAATRTALLAQPGIGPWTADYVLMRALGDPDVFLPTDVAVRRVLTAHGVDRADLERRAEAWRPWRSYALMHLWATVLDPAPDTRTPEGKDH